MVKKHEGLPSSQFFCAHCSIAHMHTGVQQTPRTSSSCLTGALCPLEDSSPVPPPGPESRNLSPYCTLSWYLYLILHKDLNSLICLLIQVWAGRKRGHGVEANPPIPRISSRTTFWATRQEDSILLFCVKARGIILVLYCCVANCLKSCGLKQHF